MAIEPSDQGFFTKEGVLRQDALRSTPAPAKDDAPAKGDSAVVDAAASAAASEITGAVVLKISNRLGVGSSGFDKGVGDMVQTAVTSALQHQRGAAPATPASSAPASPSPAAARRPVGGTYQNEMFAAANKAAEPEKAEAPAVEPEHAEKTKKAKKSDEEHGQGRRPVGGSYQNELLAEGKKAEKVA